MPSQSDLNDAYTDKYLEPGQEQDETQEEYVIEQAYPEGEEYRSEARGEEEAAAAEGETGGEYVEERHEEPDPSPPHEPSTTHQEPLVPSHDKPPTSELERVLRTFVVPDPRPTPRKPHLFNPRTPVDPSLGRAPSVVPQKRKTRSPPAAQAATDPPSRPPTPASAPAPAPVPAPAPAPPRHRATTPPFMEEMRRTKISRMFAATTGPGGSRIPEQQMSFSTITLLHGHIVQKSYLKEKRYVDQRD